MKMNNFRKIVVISGIFITIVVFLIYIAYKHNPAEEKLSSSRKMAPDEIPFRIVNYNIFGRWFGVTGYEGQDERLAAIPEAIYAHPKLGLDVDVITIEEAWCPDTQLLSGKIMCGSNESRNILISSMNKYGWKYHTDVVDMPGGSVFSKQTGGATMIFSKWPIEATSQYVYNNCSGQDCSAAKGAVYARILKTLPSGLKQVFNIISTHLQAWSTPEGAKTRAAQLTEIHDKYLPYIGIPQNKTEPLLYQGDMNTDYVLFPEEVESMLSILHAKLPDTVSGSTQLFSSDPSTNFLVGKDGAALQYGCSDEYKQSLNVGITNTGVVPALPSAKCKNFPTSTSSKKPLNLRFTNSSCELNVGDKCTAYCTCCSHEMLDYILYSTEQQYLQPVYSDFEIIPLKSIKPLVYKWGWCDGAGCLVNKDEVHDLTGSDLSDHYPVVSNFVFKTVTKDFPKIDGCKNNNDCNFKVSFKDSCYCTGPTCTIDNKPANGWDLGYNNKVNANCYFRAGAKESCFCRPGNR